MLMSAVSSPCSVLDSQCRVLGAYLAVSTSIFKCLAIYLHHQEGIKMNRICLFYKLLNRRFVIITGIWRSLGKKSIYSKSTGNKGIRFEEQKRVCANSTKWGREELQMIVKKSLLFLTMGSRMEKIWSGNPHSIFFSQSPLYIAKSFAYLQGQPGPCPALPSPVF